MKPRAIHQFHSGSAYGDAVTNSLLFTQRLLRELGFISEIYVEHIADELADQLKHYTHYKSSPNQALLIHHSMGHDLTDWLLGLSDFKILVYHNITPAYFFQKGTPLHKYSEVGREQLKLFRESISAAICDSEYNAEELAALGYRNISVIPLLINIESIQNTSPNYKIIDLNAEIFTVLFVGRICENKCQNDIVEVFRYLINMVDEPTQLVLVGSYNESDYYYQFLQELVREYELLNSVKIVGKICNRDLYSWYHVADVFVSMSEHEGFGVPLIESMLFDVPVVAYKSTNVPYTLGEAGLLFREKKFEEIAVLVNLIRQNRTFRRTILKSQRKRVQDFSHFRLKADFITALAKVGIESQELITLPTDNIEYLHFQVEGPFEISYSLAIVNRELALALEQKAPGKVALFATEGPGDYQPEAEAIQKVQGLDTLWKRSRKRSMADVVIRNLYPPRVADMDGLINLLYFAWEESIIPTKWVDSFNHFLDGLTVISYFVKKVLIDAGVYVPIQVAGCGVEQVLREKRQSYNGHLGKSFRFLHISSCFPRKGVDVLLQAYTTAFTSADDVSLIIKTFPNIHNTIQEQINFLRANCNNIADIILINEDIPTGQIIDLYHRCHAFVAPSRGEGFGLPMAEAMLFGIPVITTRFGGQTDFCTEETSWLIDFRFERAKSHLSIFNSVWAEPDVNHLVRVMKELYKTPKEKLQVKLNAAKELVERQLKWEHCASRVLNTIAKINSTKPFKSNKTALGWVTTWNSKCGIAAYSSYLINTLTSNAFNIKILASRNDITIQNDNSNVIRCWEDFSNPDLSNLEEAITKEGLEAVVIQFNFGFFEINAFGKLIQRLSEKGIKTIIVFHSTKDIDKPELKVSLRQICSQLALVDRLLVHSISDLNRLKNFGLIRNTTMFPHGVRLRATVDSVSIKNKFNLSTKKVIANYGFLLPGKGIEELIKAFSIIHKMYSDTILFLINSIYPNPTSYEYKDKCNNLISRLNIGSSIVMINEFLEDDESLCLLECADLIVFPYQQSNESSSAAVRTGLSSNRPVVCTPLEVFDDVKEVVHFLPGSNPDDIAKGIISLLNNLDLLNSKEQIQQQWLKEHSWEVISQRLSGMVQALVHDDE